MYIYIYICVPGAAHPGCLLSGAPAGKTTQPKSHIYIYIYIPGELKLLEITSSFKIDSALYEVPKISGTAFEKQRLCIMETC